MRLPFFRLCETFFENFLMSPKGPPFIFLIFCNKTNFKKSQRVPSFRFFGTMSLLKILIFFENFQKGNFSKRILLVHTGMCIVMFPLRFFEQLQQNGCFKNLKGAPFTVFGIVRFFKMNNFVLKFGFLRPSMLCPIFFSKTDVFYATFFNVFIEAPLSIFTRNET